MQVPVFVCIGLLNAGVLDGLVSKVIGFGRPRREVLQVALFEDKDRALRYVDQIVGIDVVFGEVMSS
jgi:hypothetical protein